jgi:hypothetical protein
MRYMMLMYVDPGAEEYVPEEDNVHTWVAEPDRRRVRVLGHLLKRPILRSVTYNPIGRSIGRDRAHCDETFGVALSPVRPVPALLSAPTTTAPVNLWPSLGAPSSHRNVEPNRDPTGLNAKDRS